MIFAVYFDPLNVGVEIEMIPFRVVTALQTSIQCSGRISRAVVDARNDQLARFSNSNISFPGVIGHCRFFRMGIFFRTVFWNIAARIFKRSLLNYGHVED